MTIIYLASYNHLIIIAVYVSGYLPHLHQYIDTLTTYTGTGTI